MKIVHRATGISLVEVMVTLALIAIAAGGVVRTCAHVRSSARQAAAQQAAWRLASELAEWLYLRGDKPLGKLPEDPSVLIADRDSVRDCTGTACCPEEAARFFLHDWYRRLQSSVPGARLVVSHAPLPAPQAAQQKDLSGADHLQRDGMFRFRLEATRTSRGENFFRDIEISIRRAV